VWSRFHVSNGWSLPSHCTGSLGSTTPVCSAISACGILNVDAGAAFRVHSSSPALAISFPLTDMSMKHSPGSTSMAGVALAQRTARSTRSRKRMEA
jgi:hypothetical protein